ncbi:trypsin-like peptidase domain-containing protein [Patescibacteria group bacterium]|nr:trypsin-like peptidase domain-containing protein [Patescibacteria group bacterium]
MNGTLGVIRDLGILVTAALCAALIATYTERTYTLEPSYDTLATATSTIAYDETSSPSLPTDPESEITPPKPTQEAVRQDPPSAAPRAPDTPRPQPAENAPKVEELGITLDDAISSINSLAQGQSSAAQSVNDRVRGALVNVLCSTANGTKSVTGSGVIIDPRGVILTNAHVAQFYLLRDYPTPNSVSCVIRTGSPAYPRYRAELMYLPPAWIHDNAQKIDDERPTGTGERDYALLRITGGVSASVELPAQFPFLLIARFEPRIGEDVLQAGYAAGFLGGITLLSDLYAASAWTKVRDVYTFNANTIDLVSLGGSIVAQGGSSGGPVTNKDGILMGVIVTNVGTGDTESRNLNAITTAYIIRDFESGRGKSLEAVLSTENLADEVTIFNQVYFPAMSAALKAELER